MTIPSLRKAMTVTNWLELRTCLPVTSRTSTRYLRRHVKIRLAEVRATAAAPTVQDVPLCYVTFRYAVRYLIMYWAN